VHEQDPKGLELPAHLVQWAKTLGVWL
jgi:hypothetical protein